MVSHRQCNAYSVIATAQVTETVETGWNVAQVGGTGAQTYQHIADAPLTWIARTILIGIVEHDTVDLR